MRTISPKITKHHPMYGVIIPIRIAEIADKYPVMKRFDTLCFIPNAPIIMEIIPAPIGKAQVREDFAASMVPSLKATISIDINMEIAAHKAL